MCLTVAHVSRDVSQPWLEPIQWLLEWLWPRCGLRTPTSLPLLLWPFTSKSHFPSHSFCVLEMFCLFCTILWKPWRRLRCSKKIPVEQQFCEILKIKEKAYKLFWHQELEYFFSILMHTKTFLQIINNQLLLGRKLLVWQSTILLWSLCFSAL